MARNRTNRRLQSRQERNAAAVGMPLTEWMALTAEERERRLQEVRRD